MPDFPLRDLIIDLDCYFASVEQQMHPELRGRPVAVIPVNHRSTSCIAASKEAKKFGVKTGTGVVEARQMCPEITFVESTPGAYVQIHHEFISAVEAFIPVQEILSIDEVWCLLRGPLQQRENITKLVREIKGAVARRIGTYVTCSMGVAPNRFLAKLASDMGKPDGLHVIEQSDLPHSLHGLKLRDFCGIGKNMEQRLLNNGIRTVAQLTAASKEDLHHAWGSIHGTHMWHWLRGEVTELPPTKKGVIGHSHVLPPHLRNESGIKSVCHRLLQKAAMRLRKMEYYACGVQMFIKYEQGGYWSDGVSLTETQDTFSLMQAFEQLWARHPERRGKRPTATGITFSPIIPASKVTPNLFTTSPARERLCSAMDLLNKKGRNVIHLGGSMGALDYTPMRIAFTRIPDPEVEG